MGRLRIRSKGKLDSLQCPECNNKHIVRDGRSGELVCQECGLVIQNKIITQKPEWRAFNAQEYEKRSRVGMPLSLTIADKGLSTTIGKIRQVSGASKSQKFQMYRYKKWHSRLINQSSKDRNLAIAMSELSRLSSELHIPKYVKEEAAYIYRKAFDNDLVRGRSINGIMTASLFVACRKAKLQRTLREVTNVTQLEIKDVARYYRLILRELGLKTPNPKAKHRVPKIAEKVNLEEKIQQDAINILNKAEKALITCGKDPMGLAAAALYISCKINDDKCTQKELAYAANVTEVTIRNRYKGLVKKLDIDY